MIRVIVVAVLSLALVGGALGHRRSAMEILEEGTYEELVEYRELTGRNILPWIGDEEGFQKAREWHGSWRYVGHCGW